MDGGACLPMKLFDSMLRVTPEQNKKYEFFAVAALQTYSISHWSRERQIQLHILVLLPLYFVRSFVCLSQRCAIYFGTAKGNRLAHVLLMLRSCAITKISRNLFQPTVSWPFRLWLLLLLCFDLHQNLNGHRGHWSKWNVFGCSDVNVAFHFGLLNSFYFVGFCIASNWLCHSDRSRVIHLSHAKTKKFSNLKQKNERQQVVCCEFIPIKKVIHQ